MNCRAYNSFINVYSDHRIVSARFRLSLRANKIKSPHYPPYDWSQLRTNNAIAQSFTLAVRNRFDSRQTRKCTPNETFEHFEKACKDAAEKEVPLKPKQKKRLPWESAQVTKKREELMNAAKLKNEKASRSNKARFKRAQAALAKTYQAEQTAYLQSKIDLIASTHANRQAAAAWKPVNEVCKRKSTNKSKLKASDQNERLQLWEQHFKNLLGKPPRLVESPVNRAINNELNVKKGMFTMKELTTVLNALPNGKACGLDNIPAEVWKTGAFNEELLVALCNAVYNQCPITKWTKGCLLPFPKKR